jgi:phosphoribosylaminoimidazole-succinocarboxamide synthase
MVNESYCETFGWVSKENLARMQEQPVNPRHGCGRHTQPAPSPASSPALRYQTAALPSEALLSDNEALVKKLEMVPVECVVRNRAAGSLVKRVMFRIIFQEKIEQRWIQHHPLFHAQTLNQ